MAQFNVEKHTMKKQYQEANKHHQETATVHNIEKHREGFASTNKVTERITQAEQHTSEVSKHSSPPSSFKGIVQSYRSQRRFHHHIRPLTVWI